MIGNIQRTFNKFHHRKADQNRTYRHKEILQLEQMVINTIRKSRRHHCADNMNGNYCFDYALIDELLGKEKVPK